MDRKWFRSPELKCKVQKIEYCFLTKIGWLSLPKNNHPDMGGTISLFERIDKDVEKINVCDPWFGIHHYRKVNGEWVSM